MLTNEILKKYKFLDVEDVMRITGVKQTKAYAIIRSLNNELLASGLPKHAIIRGKISPDYFYKRIIDTHPPRSPPEKPESG
ncbi:MAG: hypothetical protein FWG65_11855 [Turicibacter sp.]|nr:hypothetical protein [Turicibacter sp.]